MNDEDELTDEGRTECPICGYEGGTVELYFEDGRTEFSVSICGQCGSDE